MTSRILAPALSAFLLPALALGGLSLASPEVRAEVKSAACKVTAFLASKDGDGSIPEDLKFLEEQLRDDQFAAFKGFRLLESKTLKLGLDKPALDRLGQAQGYVDKHPPLAMELFYRKLATVPEVSRFFSGERDAMNFARSFSGTPASGCLPRISSFNDSDDSGTFSAFNRAWATASV